MQEFAPCHMPSGEAEPCLGQTDAPARGQTTERHSVLSGCQSRLDKGGLRLSSGMPPPV